MAVASLITLLYTATYIGTAFAVPAYLTYKAIEYDGPDAFRVREWSMYWTVLAAFICVQYLVDFALSWLPFYYILKLGFLGALWAPSTRLALTIYKSALGPLLSTHEADLDTLYSTMWARAADAASQQTKMAKYRLQRVAGKASTMLHQAQHNAGLERSRAAAAAGQLRHAGAGGLHAPHAAEPQAGLRHRNVTGPYDNNMRVDAAGDQAPSMLRPARAPEDPATPTAASPVDLGLH